MGCIDCNFFVRIKSGNFSTTLPRIKNPLTDRSSHCAMKVNVLSFDAAEWIEIISETIL